MRLPRSALALCAIALVACAPSLASRADEQQAPPSVVTVDNQRTEDATIYIRHAGVTGRRLGKVESLSRATFALTAVDGAPGSEFELLAKMFANGWTDVSDPVPLERGAHYTWQLAPMRGQQFVSWRYASMDGTSTVLQLAALRHDGDRLPGNPLDRWHQ